MLCTFNIGFQSNYRCGRGASAPALLLLLLPLPPGGFPIMASIAWTMTSEIYPGWCMSSGGGAFGGGGGGGALMILSGPNLNA